jgi:hypothetical protein
MHARILRPACTHPVKTHKPFFANTVLTSTVTPLLLSTDHGQVRGVGKSYGEDEFGDKIVGA